jgi:methionyl-tRNA synthetase
LNKDTKNIFDDFNYDVFRSIKPPEENSDKFKEEIEYLKSLPFNKKFVEDKDDIVSSFKEVFDRHNIKFPEKTINKLIKDSTKVIKDLKLYFNRTRPWKYMGDNNILILGSMETPSYPSGHSTQSELVYKFLSDYYPELSKDLKKMANDISLSRNVARAHYPSDSKVGQLLGDTMYEYLKQS